MSLTIKDGNNGNILSVDGEGQIGAKVSDVPRYGWASWKGAQAYQCNTGEMIIPSPLDVPMPVGGYPVYWRANTSKTKALVTSYYISNQDGGGSNPAFFRLRAFGSFAAAKPIANMKPDAFARRMNLYNLSTPDIEMYAWNGVGAGLTIPGFSGTGFAPTAVLKNESFLRMCTEDSFITPPGFMFADVMTLEPVNLAAGQVLHCQLAEACYHIDQDQLSL